LELDENYEVTEFTETVNFSVNRDLPVFFTCAVCCTFVSKLFVTKKVKHHTLDLTMAALTDHYLQLKHMVAN